MRWAICCMLMLLTGLVNAYPVTEFKIHREEVVRVYDGDTFFITLDYLPDIFGKELGVRITGIDTPELKSTCPTKEAKLIEKEQALQAKAFLEQTLANARVIRLVLSTEGNSRDKYFRLDATVMVDGQDVGELLISKRMAVYYDGNTKKSWCTLP